MTAATYDVTSKDGRTVSPGEVILDFRGDPWVFLKVTRGTEYNGTARVLVRSATFHNWEQDYYATVFNLTVVTL